MTDWKPPAYLYYIVDDFIDSWDMVRESDGAKDAYYFLSPEEAQDFIDTKMPPSTRHYRSVGRMRLVKYD